MSRTAQPNQNPRARADCDQCHGVGHTVIRMGAFASAEPCVCLGPCPECGDAGFVATSDAFRAPMRRCGCQVSIRRLERFNEVGIPARHFASTLSSFQPTPDVMPIFSSINAYIRDFHPGEINRGFLIFGEVGRGKTHLMAATLRELVLRYGISARFVEFSHLLADIKGTFDKGGGASELMEPLTRVDVLAIDEMGKGRNTEFEGTVLDELISRRYNAGSTILATSNYKPGHATGRGTPGLTGIAKHGKNANNMPTLADRVGDRVYSRLREMNDFYPLHGEDYRETIRRQKAVARRR